MISRLTLARLPKTEAEYPLSVRQLLGDQTPDCLFALGNLDTLRQKKTALFCSLKCPGRLILKAYDLARKLREAGATVISGFHSPMERECLSILLRGNQPIIICPARSLEGMRLPADWKTPLAEGRVLLLSPFPKNHRRASAELARQRNILVAALADEACFVHVSPGGSLDELQQRVAKWNIPIMNL